MKRLGTSRRELFEKYDRPELKPLPPVRYEMAEWKQCRVNIDYHVEYEHNLYSVPYALVGQRVEVRATAGCVEVYLRATRVASHPRLTGRGRVSTLPEHMPASHRAHLEWTPAKLIAWGERIGLSTAALVTWQLQRRPHPEQGYRACLGLLALARKYTPERLEAACTRAMAIRAPTLRSVTNILKCGLDSQPALFMPAANPVIEHENVRGPDYYH